MGEFQDSPCRHIPLPSLRLPSSHPSLTQRIVYVCTRGIVFVVEIFFAPRPVENFFPIGRFLSLGRNFLSGELFHENGPLGLAHRLVLFPFFPICRRPKLCHTVTFI